MLENQILKRDNGDILETRLFKHSDIVNKEYQYKVYSLTFESKIFYFFKQLLVCIWTEIVLSC